MNDSIIAVSDIHGSKSAVELIKKAIERYRPSMVLSLGDQCPYENEPLFYNLISVKGNCDSPYDYRDIPLPPPYREVTIFNRRAILTHGDRYSYRSFSMGKGDLFIHGHTHVPELTKKDSFYVINPGSAAYPRSSLGPTFALFEKEKVSVLSLLDFKNLMHLRYSD